MGIRVEFFFGSPSPILAASHQPQPGSPCLDILRDKGELGQAIVTPAISVMHRLHTFILHMLFGAKSVDPNTRASYCWVQSKECTGSSS